MVEFEIVIIIQQQHSRKKSCWPCNNSYNFLPKLQHSTATEFAIVWQFSIQKADIQSHGGLYRDLHAKAYTCSCTVKMLLQRSFTSLCNKLDKRKDEMALEALHFHQSIQILRPKTFKDHSLNILNTIRCWRTFFCFYLLTKQCFFSSIDTMNLS